MTKRKRRQKDEDFLDIDGAYNVIVQGVVQGFADILHGMSFRNDDICNVASTLLLNTLMFDVRAGGEKAVNAQAAMASLGDRLLILSKATPETIEFAFESLAQVGVVGRAPERGN